MTKAYRISLFGAFNILGPKGDACQPSGEKACGLIALLATASHFKRSRSWLKSMLWSDADENKASASLRSCLYELRRHFGEDTIISSDRRDVWLNRDQVAIEPTRQGEFLEGIDVSEEPFEDWLREQRSAMPRAGLRSQLIVYPDAADFNYESRLPTIAIYPVVAHSEEDRIHAELITEIVIKTLWEQRCVDVYDLSHLDDLVFEPSHGSPAFGLIPRMVSTGCESHFSLTMKNLVTGQILWSRWFADVMHRGAKAAEDFMTKTVAEIANAVHDQIYHQCQAVNYDGLFGAIQCVLSHSKEGQDRARPWLSDAASESGVARAWLMYTFAVAHAERHDGLGPGSMDELKEHCHLANLSEPANPIVQAIIGHINAFVFRNFEKAEAHHATARKQGWNQPIVWTLSAMHANYTNRPETAYYYSSHAMKQSTFSPNRFYFEGPHSISCSLTHRHEEAISIGESILVKKPGFLAVMRHLAASQVLLGRVDQARNTIACIREKDSRFVHREVAANDYPLPSRRSVELIEQAFAATDR